MTEEKDEYMHPWGGFGLTMYESSPESSRWPPQNGPQHFTLVHFEYLACWQKNLHMHSVHASIAGYIRKWKLLNINHRELLQASTSSLTLLSHSRSCLLQTQMLSHTSTPESSLWLPTTHLLCSLANQWRFRWQIRGKKQLLSGCDVLISWQSQHWNQLLI